MSPGSAGLVCGGLLALAVVLVRVPGRSLPPKEPAPAPALRIDAAMACDLVCAALSAGASIPAAVEGVGLAIGGPDGERLAICARLLLLGASWEEAWDGVHGEWSVVRDAVGPAWLDGVAPGPGLRAAASRTRARRAAVARERAGQLGVRLVLPLGLCLLPAFLLLGLVPVILSAGSTLLGRG